MVGILQVLFDFDIHIDSVREFAGLPGIPVVELAGAQAFPGVAGGKGSHLGHFVALDGDVFHGRSPIQGILVRILDVEGGTRGKLAHGQRDIQRHGTVGGRGEPIPEVVVGVVVRIALAVGIGAGDGAFVGQDAVLVDVEIAGDLLRSGDAEEAGTFGQVREGELDGTHRGLEGIRIPIFVDLADQDEVLQRVVAGSGIVLLGVTVNLDVGGHINGRLAVDEAGVVRVNGERAGGISVFQLSGEGGGHAVFLGLEGGNLIVAFGFVVGIDVDLVAGFPGEGLVVGIGGTGVFADRGFERVGDEGLGGLLGGGDGGLDFLGAGNGQDSRQCENAINQLFHGLAFDEDSTLRPRVVRIVRII